MQAHQRQSLTEQIRRWATELGFDVCGIAKAEYLGREADHLERWLASGKHGSMDWLARTAHARVDPAQNFPGIRSVVSVIQNYFPENPALIPLGSPQIAKYAWGEDYHHVMRRKLQRLVAQIEQALGTPITHQIHVDSTAALDKAWAVRAGLGWLGKNTNLLRKGQGSFFLLGEIFLDLELEHNQRLQTDHCGDCTRCIDACPTGALRPYEIDATRCISYLTIEHKQPTPDAFRPQLQGWAFGCDICQDVCPWNRHAKPHSEPAFAPLELAIRTLPTNPNSLTSTQYRKRSTGTPFRRVRHPKMMDNLAAANASLVQATPSQAPATKDETAAKAPEPNDAP